MPRNAYVQSDPVATTLSELRGGLIQFFETTFELGWKLLKDYLEAQGVVAISPREAIKHAYQMTLIANGQGWLEALEDRNLIAHTYDEATCLKLERLIADKYFPLLQALHDTFNSKAE